ncbi:serine/threonine-protein kinase [Massilia sp. CF038]|uniref:serine/threonine-protein kinase n=1 Tax=Massilia sp. CF038 TaxID=1881045 RepID=UPI000919E311|nr:serine/threonine-protein kinase [Massilia sp. CF038]SHG97560.1 serine/threonine protein kinase [Massilia sp. CF038]
MQLEQDLGHYKLLRVLGEGGFGEVVEAWDTRLQRSVAIKRLKPHLLTARPDDLLEEARLAASLRHPAFVRIFSIDGDRSQLSIIMEYVAGHTLRELGARGPLPLPQVLSIVGQVADAMAQAHAANLIHGDLKPSNLMLDAEGAVRILDFGLARRIDPDATEVAPLEQSPGTVAYLAPELMLGTAPGAASDIYALGVVMFEMLTGARPFAHLSGLSLAAAHIQSSSATWEFPPETSAPVAALVRAMTARDLTQRLPSMEAVGARLATLGAPAVVLPAAPASAPPARWRNKLFMGGAGAALVLGAALLLAPSGWYKQHTPFFSEAVAMREGMYALKTFDRDESLEIAIERFNAILERKPDHAGAAAGLAIAYNMRHVGDSRDETWLQRADASAQLALRLNDQLAMAYTAQAAVRLGQGKKEDALRLIEHSLRLDPLDVFALTIKADILIRMARFGDAQTHLDSALAVYPNERKLLDVLGLLRFEQGDYKGAEAAFRRSIAAEPDSVMAYANLSYALLRQDRGDESLQVLQQGLQVRPNGSLYTNLGNALFNRGDYVGAAQAFENAVSSARGNSNTYVRWANLADTLRWIPGREQASREAYRQALALLKPLLERSPKDATMMSRMGLYSARLGEREQAAALTRRALVADPDSADVRYRAAMAYELSGQREAALEQLLLARQRGYPLNLINAEPDLIALRRDSRFHQSTILESAK